MHVSAVLKSRLLIASAAALTLAAAVVAAAIFSTPVNHPHPEHAAGDPHGGASVPVDPPASPSAATAPTLLATPAPRGRPVSVSVATGALGSAVPAGFIGLSFEVRDLPTLAGYATKGDLVALLRSLGPGMMRFGGVSADEQAAWVPAGASKPAWASTAIDEGDLAGIAALAKASGWSVLLSVNLGHYEPTAAASEAAAARAQLGSQLAGIEIGNEPDLFPRKHLRPPGAGVRGYLPQAAAYRAAIEAAAPGVAIAGPDPSTGTQGFTWIRAAASTLHPQLLTDHYYPLTSCDEHPTISELLSPHVRSKESAMLAAMVSLARTYRTPLRMDETNDISCEGEPGVSNTFAAALWALDYTARAMSAGVAGVNFHDLIAQPDSYSPLAADGGATLAAGELRAAPEWYGLLAAHVFMGAGPSASPSTGRPAGAPGPPPGRALRAAVTGAAPGELTATAMRAPDGKLSLVLVDYDPPGSTPLAVRLRVPPALAGGSVLALTGPSSAATDGIRLGGRAVAADGRWSPPRALPAVHGRAGSLSVQIAPDSGVVITLAPHSRLGRATRGVEPDRATNLYR